MDKINRQYGSWSGSASELAEEANKLAPAGEGITGRTVHYYRNRGVISPPDGKSFSERHLAEAVAAKVLQSEGWKIEKIAETFASISGDELDSIIARAALAGLEDNAPAEQNKAQMLVDSFRKRSGVSGEVRGYAFGASAESAPAGDALAKSAMLRSEPPLNVCHPIQVSYEDWATCYVSRDADEAEIDKAFDAMRRAVKAELRKTRR